MLEVAAGITGYAPGIHPVIFPVLTWYKPGRPFLDLAIKIPDTLV
jgi:hypothetical protein